MAYVVAAAVRSHLIPVYKPDPVRGWHGCFSEAFCNHLTTTALRVGAEARSQERVHANTGACALPCETKYERTSRKRRGTLALVSISVIVRVCGITRTSFCRPASRWQVRCKCFTYQILNIQECIGYPVLYYACVYIFSAINDCIYLQYVLIRTCCYFSWCILCSVRAYLISVVQFHYKCQPEKFVTVFKYSTM